MTIKSDKWIRSKCLDVVGCKPMIEPFFCESINTDSKGNKIPSFGLSSYGYDVRLGRNFKIFKNSDNNPNDNMVQYFRNGHEFFHSIPRTTRIVDIRNFDVGDPLFLEISDIDSIVLHPGGFLLAHTEEIVRVPRNVSVVCMGKSTIARAALIVTVTPLEAEWEGITTLEITNTSPLPVRLYAGDGICQMQFHESDEECETSYADRGGKYQHQGKEPVTPKF